MIAETRETSERERSRAGHTREKDLLAREALHARKRVVCVREKGVWEKLEKSFLRNLLFWFNLKLEKHKTLPTDFDLEGNSLLIENISTNLLTNSIR